MAKIKKFSIAVLIYICGVNYAFTQICWKEYDPEYCGYSLITEYGISTSVYPDFRLYEDYTLGIKKHINSRFAVGPTLLIKSGFFSKNYFGLGGRFSYHPDRTLYEINMSPNLFLRNRSNHLGFGAGIEVGLNYKNYLGVYSRLDYLGDQNATEELHINLGIKTGGLYGPIAAGGGIVIKGVLVLGTLMLIMGLLST